jgi:pimeloyl-ACP methyl ester carboxylesterase
MMPLITDKKGAKMPNTQTTGLLFLQGAGLSTAIWKETVGQLTMPCLLAEYPLADRPAKERNQLTLNDYTDAVMQQVDAWPVENVIIVAHSIGGALALPVAQRLGSRLKGFVAVGAVIPRNGGSYISALPYPNKLILALIMRLAGTKAPEAAIRKSLCSGLTKEQADEVVAQSVAESKHLYFDKTHASIPSVPRLYIRLTEDKELPPALQDTMAANLGATEVKDVAFGHMAMMGRPADIAAILTAFASPLR